MTQSTDVLSEEHLQADPHYPLRDLSRGLIKREIRPDQVSDYILFAFSMLDSANDSIFIHGVDGRIIYANKTGCESRGYTKEELLSINMYQLYPQYFAATLDNHLNRVKEEGRILFEAENIGKNGIVIPVETHMRYAIIGELGLVLTVSRNITGRKQAEDRLKEDNRILQSLVRKRTANLLKSNKLLKEQLRKIECAEEAVRRSEEQFKLLFNSSPEGIVFLNKDGIIIDVNQQVITRLPITRQDLIGQNILEILPIAGIDPANVQSSLHRLANEDTETGKFEWYMKNDVGNVITLEVIPIAIREHEELIGFALFVEDITDRTRMEEERQRLEKLESLGVLAGGIAHDFNNILTAILGNISLARMDTVPGSGIHYSLKQAEKASLRAKRLTQQLLTFSKGGAPVKKLCSLDQLLRDTADFALRGSNVKCTLSIPDDLWHAEIDEGQVSQVIHNIVINAQQAMPTGGTIELMAENITLCETHKLSSTMLLKEGNYIRIAVTDHGSGIPAVHLERIFDPFFSTKQKGSGLGLATSFSIARSHGGHLSVESVLGSGSTFYFYLPASMETYTPQQDIKEEIKLAGKARGLVMDDEEAVREIAGRLLKHIGYEDIEFAVDGSEAIKLYKTAMDSGRPFNFVILDLTVPGGMGGEETIRKLLEVDSGVKAIVSSGYADKAVMSHYKKYGFSGMVTKPYTFEELGEVLIEVIGQDCNAEYGTFS